MIFNNGLSQRGPADRSIMMSDIFGLDPQDRHELSGTSDVSTAVNQYTEDHERTFLRPESVAMIATSPLAEHEGHDTGYLARILASLPTNDISSLSAGGNSSSYLVSDDRNTPNSCYFDEFVGTQPSLDLLNTSSIWEINWDGVLL
jgi:hypothetical protein